MELDTGEGIFEALPHVVQIEILSLTRLETGRHPTEGQPVEELAAACGAKRQEISRANSRLPAGEGVSEKDLGVAIAWAIAHARGGGSFHVLTRQISGQHAHLTCG